MSEREERLRAFHAAHTGATSRAFARTGSYARLAATARGRVLDLACGDAPVPGAIGVDLSYDELARAANNVSHDGLARTKANLSHDGPSRTPANRSQDGLARTTNTGDLSPATTIVVQARAQALPFADASFDACVCHLGFMLFDDIDRVVAELSRVLRPRCTFAALLGGGPVEPPPDGDAFHRFLALATFDRTRFGDPRAKTEAGWRALFPGWTITFERIELELGGTFDEAWSFLGASYGLVNADRVRAQLHAELGDRASCRVACYLATARR